MIDDSEMTTPPENSDNSQSAAVWDILDTARTPAERVAEARRLLLAGAPYPQGCSGFMSAVLGITWEDANALMGAAPRLLGRRPPYPQLAVGDVVGWKNTGGDGHVALYVSASTAPGYADMFIDVEGRGGRPRLKNGFYDHDLYESSRF